MQKSQLYFVIYTCVIKISLYLCPIKLNEQLKPNDMITKELYESPMKQRNEDKYGYITDQCICCGKPMKSGEKLYVHMNVNWLAVNPTINEEDCKELTGAESQGCFPIGNDCAKKMIGFTFLMK